MQTFLIIHNLELLNCCILCNKKEIPAVNLTKYNQPQANMMFSELINTIQVILMLVLVLLFL